MFIYIPPFYLVEKQEEKKSNPPKDPSSSYNTTITTSLQHRRRHGPYDIVKIDLNLTIDLIHPDIDTALSLSLSS